MSNFNIRVYGIYKEYGNILITDERVKGVRMTKFPGGGLEEGEGTRDCLKREWMEELNQKVEIGEHVYTTDFYQESGFDDGSQIVAIYYEVKPIEPLKVTLSSQPFDFGEEEGRVQRFRMIPLEIFSSKDVTFPIDKVVVDSYI